MGERMCGDAIIEWKLIEKIWAAFTGVADIVADDAESYKFVLNWIEKIIKDLSKQIHYGGETTVIRSCSNNVKNTIIFH